MLDEQVSSLDLSHQIAVMGRARRFAHAESGALIMLHDLNFAVQGADRLIVLHRGSITADGVPSAVLTDDLLQGVYDCAVRVDRVPRSGPFLLIQSGDGAGTLG